MEIDISLVISIVSIAIVIANFFIGYKKSNSNDGYFVGKVETKLDIIEKKIDDLCKKYEEMPKEIDERIENKLMQHIREYHSKE